jgi:NTE family protein
MAEDSALKPILADLVLEGGGVKGIGLVGAISVLKENNYQFQRIAGTSAGAIVGSLIAAGATADQAIELMRALDYKKFRDPTIFSRLGAPGKVLSLIFQNGIYSGDYLRIWLTEQLATYGVRTFGDLKLSGDDLKDIPAAEAYKLVIVTADLSKGELVYLPWDYHKYGLDPDTQLVADAVRASMSIPYFYTPAHIGKDTFVDGGMLSNFPIDIFDSTPEWPTFGIKLSAEMTADQVPHTITGPLSLADALFATMMNGRDQRHLDDPSTLRRTMFVDTGKIQSTDFDITKAEQESLFKNGQAAATKFMRTWSFAQYEKDFSQKTR